MGLVRNMLDVAQDRLVLLPMDGVLGDAATRLHAGTDMLVLTASDGQFAGIVTKTDIIARLTRGEALNTHTPLCGVARTQVHTCTAGSALRDVWSMMQVNGIKNVPVLNGQRPVGLLNARDLLQRLLSEVENEEELLRDYVMGVGYR